METSNIDDSLPEIFVFPGEWGPYEEALYDIFKDTLLINSVYFQGLRVSIKYHPDYKGKHFSFWHLISEGEKEDERIPDFRRCERLAWISWVIKNCDNCLDIYWWENNRGAQKHVVIWYEKENYAVILAKRNNYFLLKTAYLATPHRAKAFNKERDSFGKSKS